MFSKMIISDISIKYYIFHVQFYKTLLTSLFFFLVHICPVKGDPDKQEPLCLIKSGRRFCVFSVAFSSDGQEILGGANDGFLYIYDRQRNQRSLKVSFLFCWYIILSIQ